MEEFALFYIFHIREIPQESLFTLHNVLAMWVTWNYFALRCSCNKKDISEPHTAHEKNVLGISSWYWLTHVKKPLFCWNIVTIIFIYLSNTHHYLLSSDKFYLLFSCVYICILLLWKKNGFSLVGFLIFVPAAGHSRAQNIYHRRPIKHKKCITVVQRLPNVFVVGPTLYKCYTNVLCLLGPPPL